MSCSRGCCASPAEHFRSVGMRGFPSDTELMARQWDRDMPAYKRLRRQGLQPPGIDGCRQLEQVASMQQEITLGTAITDPDARALARDFID